MAQSKQWVLVMVGLSACAAGHVDTRSLFANLTYDNRAAPKPLSSMQLEWELYAALEPEGITTYKSAGPVADCYRKVTPKVLEEIGEALSEAKAEDRAITWGTVDAAWYPWVTKSCPDVVGVDRALVAYSVVHMAGAVAAFARATTLGSPDAIDAAAVKAIGRLADLLANTGGPRPTPIINSPVLALSGGSANGAFTAGFLFELLWARERALLMTPAGPTRDKQDRRSRFAGVVGTSVGALISQVMDLYGVDPHTPLSAAQEQYLTACLSRPETPAPAQLWPASPSCFSGDPTPTFPGLPPPAASTERRVQRCALELLHHSFTDIAEPDLMCIEPGPVTRVVGLLGEPSMGLMRFDAMSRQTVDPLLRDFAPLLLDNDCTRVVVSVDMELNQPLGLDERSCRGLPTTPFSAGEVAPQGSEAYCLSSAVMASVVLPFFARPLRHTYAGFRAGGECSTWNDGGLRSGFPVLRALRLSRPRALYTQSPELLSQHRGELRVLGIDTGRRNGLPNARPANIVDVSFNAIGQMASANTVDEFALAQLASSQREREFHVMRDALQEKAPPPKSTAVPTTDAGVPVEEEGVELEGIGDVPDAWSVASVYVPSEVPPGIVADSGYAFDRYVMRGLFTWGRKVALSRMLGDDPESTGDPAHQLPVQLGWPQELVEHVLLQARTDLADATLSRWQQAYTLPECPAYRQERMAAGVKRLMSDATADCRDVRDQSGQTPHYFLCPASGTDLAPADAGVSP
jgi:hypothetical protein